MKLDKRYYQNLLEQMGKRLLIDKNKIAQQLDKELKDSGLTFTYETNELDIKINFKKKEMIKNIK